MTSKKMNVERRTEVGSNRVNKMRVKNLIPGVIYSRGEETQHIVVDNVEFTRIYRTVGTSSMFDVVLDGETQPVIIKEIQKHPFKNQYMHIDLQKLNMDEAIRMHIPINFINRDNIVIQPSVFMQLLDQVEIECLPGNIPYSADVDVSDLDFATSKTVSDLDIASDDKILILTDLDTAICTLTEPSMEEDLDEEETDEELLEGEEEESEEESEEEEE